MFIFCLEIMSLSPLSGLWEVWIQEDLSDVIQHFQTHTQSRGLLQTLKLSFRQCWKAWESRAEDAAQWIKLLDRWLP